MFSDSVYINTEYRSISFVVNHRLCRKLYNLFQFHFPIPSNDAAAAKNDDDR